jgi:hypothetical protein
MEKPFDPGAMWREMLGQWEQAVNRYGGEAMRSEQFVQGMGGATAAAAQGQQATHEVMTRWLAAMNMPSRAEFADLSARLARIEEAVHRIEAAVTPHAAAPSPARPRPRRTRTAPPPAPKAPKP